MAIKVSGQTRTYWKSKIPILSIPKLDQRSLPKSLKAAPEWLLAKSILVISTTWMRIPSTVVTKIERIIPPLNPFDNKRK